MACNNILGTFYDNEMAHGYNYDKKFKFKSWFLRLFNRKAYDLYYDFQILK